MRKIRSCESMIIAFRKRVGNRHPAKAVDPRTVISRAHDDSLYIQRSLAMVLT